MANEQMLLDTLWAVKEDQEHWDQTAWVKIDPVCGTVCCFAGWAVQLSPKYELMAHEGGHRKTGARDRKTGKFVEISEAARGVLDINVWQGAELFDGLNSLDRLEEVVKGIISGEIVGKEENAE